MKVTGLKKWLMPGTAIALSAVYLTFVLDVFTLNTKLKCLYILGYFCVMGAVLLWLRRRYVPKASKGTRLLAGTLALCLLIGFQGFFLPTQKESLITLSAVGAEGERPQKEIWLSGIEVDGEVMPLAEIAVENNMNWTFIPEYGSYVFYPAEGVSENWLTLNVLAKNIALRLEQNSWSGELEIQNSGEVTRIDLSSEEQTAMDHALSVERTYATWQRVLFNIGAFIVLFFFVEALAAVGREKKWIKLQWNVVALWCVSLLSYVILFWINDRIAPDQWTQLLLLVLTVAGTFALQKKNNVRGG